MLAPETIGLIKLTVPALAAHGETLTRHFYRRMFAGNPETLPFFNPAHQHTGGQQKALAAAICAYAQHIETPAVLSSALELIAQKHCSLGIQPEHYSIVGEHLLGSIQEVLGDAATPAIIDAWAAAYGFLADVLIQREAEIYAHHERSHGFHGFQPFVVAKKIPESSTITSFHLAPKSGQPLCTFLPGQYITVRVLAAGGHSTTMRNYSLSCAPNSPRYRISVKRETGPTADTPRGHVSNYLHDLLHPGDTLQISPPCGNFTLQSPSHPSRPLVLLSAGVGITPVLSMLHASLAKSAPRRDILFLHAAINGDTHAFRHEVLSLAATHPNLRTHFRYSKPTPADRQRELFDSEGFLDSALLNHLLPAPHADVYLCGPKPFMAAAHQSLLSIGADPSSIHYEFFGPQQQLLQPAPAAVI